MRLRRLEVERFRGICSLDWKFIEATSALVGPGDSGKSTILEAIEAVLSPRWNLNFDDSDFWDGCTTMPIVIRATVTEFPKGFHRDDKFGLALHAFDDATSVARKPQDDDESWALVIQLTVEADLEPRWAVRSSDGTFSPISARDREALGMVRVGGYVDRHLGWSRGSVLARITESGDDLSTTLAEATRSARLGLDRSGLGKLTEAAKEVEGAAREFGAAPSHGFAPHLDATSMSVRTGSLSLHDGEVPLRRAGLGTRRLVAMAMQRQAARSTGLTVVDELEHGLEPHRIRRLLRVLRGRAPEKEVDGTVGQLVFSTHSPAVLSELGAEEVCVTRRTPEGKVTVMRLPEALMYLLPKTPDALLARKVVVAEGATELGLCLALDEAWAERDGASFAYSGVAVVDGAGGTKPAEVSGQLRRLGYDVAVLIDSDAKAKPSRARDAVMLAWPGGVSTEERLAMDLPSEGLREMSELAARSPKAKGSKAVAACLADACKADRASLSEDDPRSWLDALGEDALRTALGSRAKSKKNGWFKRKDLAWELGELVVKHWDGLDGTPTREVIEKLRRFVHSA